MPLGRSDAEDPVMKDADTADPSYRIGLRFVLKDAYA